MSAISTITGIQAINLDTCPPPEFQQMEVSEDALIKCQKPETFEQLMKALAFATEEVLALRPKLFTAKQAFHGVRTERNRNAYLKAQRKLNSAAQTHERLALQVQTLRQLQEV